MYKDKVPKWMKILKVISNLLGKMLTFFIIICSIITITLVFQTVKKKDEIPNFMGYKILQVASGSMNDEFDVGDVILIKKVKIEDIHKGDIITFRKKDIVTHRIIDINKSADTMYYTTKGDSNNAIDSEKVKFEEIEGKYITKFVYLGHFIKLLNTTKGFIILVSIPIIIIVLTIFKELKIKEKKSKRRIRRLDYELQQKNK